MNNMYDILAKLNSVGKQNLTEGWKGELAGGTAGGIAGTIAGNAISPGIGGMVGGALGATAGGMAGRAAGGALDETSQLNEIAPLIAAGARIAGPMIGKIAQALGRGASTAGKATADAAGKAAAGVGRGVADVSKEVGKAAVANAPAVGVGVGAYEIAKQMADKMPDAVNQVYSDVGQTAKAVTSVVGDALGSATVMDLAGAAVKYAIPAGLLLAVLYGGKKLIDKVMSEDAMMEENDMRGLLDKLDYVAEGWKGTAAGAGLGALAGGPLGAAAGALAGDKIGDEMEEGKRPDFPDLDRDGDKKEPMAQAARQAKGKEQVDEISLDKIGRGIGKAIGVPARVAGAVAGIPGGLKQAYQSSKAGAQKAISGQDMDCYPKGAKVAVGEADVEEGNDFTGARMAAIKAGKPTFSVDGKTYKVTGDTSDERVMEKKEKTLFPGTPEYEKRFPKELRPGERAKSSTGGTIEKTATGVRHTARYDDDTDADDGSKAAQADKYASPKAKGRPKGSKRALGAKGPTGKSKLLNKGSLRETDLEEDSYPFPVKQTQAGTVVDNRLLAQKILTVASELGPKSQGMMSKMLRPGQTQKAEAVAEIGEWLARAFNDQAGYEGAQLVDMMKNPTGPYAKYGHAYNSLFLALKEKGIDLLAAADGIKYWNTLRKGSSQQAMAEDYDQDEYDEEGEMAKSQSRTIADAAEELQHMLADNENLPEWVQKKITLAQEYIDSARDYLAANRPDAEVMAEKAVSKAQRAAAGIARAAQKGEIPKSELRGASKEMAKMPAGELKKFAKTKEKGLPEKVKKEEVEETTVSGSVAPAASAPKAKKGGMVFGKGVYEGQIAESFEKKLNTVLTEGISINASQGEDGQKTLTVNATDDDAVKLAQLLQLAGMPQGSGYQAACSSCGGMHEGECLDEADLANSPDEQTMDTEMMVNTMSGGLNGQKTTGQTTGAPFNAQPARQGALHGRMEEVVESNEGRLWKLYQRYETRK